MRFKAIFNLPTEEPEKWKRKVAVEMEAALEKGIIAWLNAATAPVPVWSGASLATFKPLASRVNFALAITPTANGARRGQGTSAGSSRSTGTININTRVGTYFAEYSTSLKHLIFNEFNNANAGGDPAVWGSLRTPGPYNFQIAGAAAFQASVSGVRLPFPKLTSKKRITV